MVYNKNQNGTVFDKSFQVTKVKTRERECNLERVKREEGLLNRMRERERRVEKKVKKRGGPRVTKKERGQVSGSKKRGSSARENKKK